MTSGLRRTPTRLVRRSGRRPAGARRSALAAVAQRIDVSIRIAHRLERSGHFRSAAQAYLRLAEGWQRVARMTTLERGSSMRVAPRRRTNAKQLTRGGRRRVGASSPARVIVK